MERNPKQEWSWEQTGLESLIHMFYGVSEKDRQPFDRLKGKRKGCKNFVMPIGYYKIG